MEYELSHYLKNGIQLMFWYLGLFMDVLMLYQVWLDDDIFDLS